jgi:hypothetical protein
MIDDPFGGITCLTFRMDPRASNSSNRRRRGTSAANPAVQDFMRKKAPIQIRPPKPSAPQKARSHTTWRAEIGLLWHVVPVAGESHDKQVKAETDGCERPGPNQTRSGIKFRGAWATIVQFVRSGHKTVTFHVARDDHGHLAFTDARDCIPGTTGMTGARRRLPLPPQPIRGRSMNVAAFTIEATRYVGVQKAEEIVRVVTCNRGE